MLSDNPFDEDIPTGHGNDQAIWIEPKLVCTVNFIKRTTSGGMRQPIFKVLWEDKQTTECIIKYPL